MHEKMLEKIKTNFFIFSAGALLLIAAGLVAMIFIEDKILCGCISIIGLFLLYITFSKYGGKNKDNTYVVEAECESRSRVGYRKQYFEYLFKTGDGKSFEIRTSRKEKFKVGLKYNMCFKKQKDKENEQIITGNDLIIFELK